jgi:hypothetical protein
LLDGRKATIQLGEREVLAIKLTTPAICLSTIDDDFFMLGVISLFDKMQHLSIDFRGTNSPP